MGSIRIGIPDFISVRPLVFGLLRGTNPRVTVTYGEASTLADDLQRGRLGAALVPSLEYLRGVGRYLIDGPALVARPALGSLTLLARKPIDEIDRVAVGEFSRTAIAVLRFVLSECCGVTPDLAVCKGLETRWREEFDAVLLSNDSALAQLRAPRNENETAHNVARMWHDLTGHPLVMAVWAYNDEALRPELTKSIVSSRNLGQQNLSRLADGIARTAGYDSEVLYDYLSSCWDYNLGTSEHEGLDALEALSRRYSLLKNPLPESTRHARTCCGDA